MQKRELMHECARRKIITSSIKNNFWRKVLASRIKVNFWMHAHHSMEYEMFSKNTRISLRQGKYIPDADASYENELKCVCAIPSFPICLLLLTTKFEEL